MFNLEPKFALDSFRRPRIRAAGKSIDIAIRENLQVQGSESFPPLFFAPPNSRFGGRKTGVRDPGQYALSMLNSNTLTPYIGINQDLEKILSDSGSNWKSDYQLQPFQDLPSWLNGALRVSLNAFQHKKARVATIGLYSSWDLFSLAGESPGYFPLGFDQSRYSGDLRPNALNLYKDSFNTIASVLGDQKFKQVSENTLIVVLTESNCGPDLQGRHSPQDIEAIVFGHVGGNKPFSQNRVDFGNAKTIQRFIFDMAERIGVDQTLAGSMPPSVFQSGR